VSRTRCNARCSANGVIPRESGGSSTPQHRDRSQMPRILDRPLEPVIGRRAAPTRWRAMTASFDRAACRSPRHTPGLGATGDQDNHSEGFGGVRAPALAARHGERGRRRTRQDQISLGQRLPVKLRTQDPHRTKKTCFFCRTGFVRANSFENAIQPFDLMSRRHPLSSTEPSDLQSAFRKQIVSEGSSDVPASSRWQFS